MNLRIEGLPDEVTATVALLRDCRRIRVVAVSRGYPNRGDDQRIRVYLTVVYLSGSAPAEVGQR